MDANSPPDGLTQLQHVADTLGRGDAHPQTTVRQLLQWFGQQRRGWRVISTIQGALRRTGLQTKPDFATAYIDGDVIFLLDHDESLQLARSKKDSGNTAKPEEVNPGDPEVPTKEFEDPVLRVRMLPAANRKPVTVTRDDPVDKALLLMLMRDYSQLPVTQNMRVVDGMISWRSISLARMRGDECTTVRQCLAKHEEVRADDSLFTAFRKIVRHEAVLVRGGANVITGIVTTTDLSIMFREQTEPFLLLSETENQLRRLINGRFSHGELGVAKDPGDENRQVDSVSDLTFGECARLLEQPEHWQRLSVGLDRKTFVKQLSYVREIRNDVMHFDPDGLSASELQKLKDVRRLLQGVLADVS